MSGSKKSSDFSGKVLQFPLRPEPAIPRAERPDTRGLTTERLRYVCGSVMDASIQEDKAGRVAPTAVAWFLKNSNRVQLEKFMSWMYGELEG